MDCVRNVDSIRPTMMEGGISAGMDVWDADDALRHDSVCPRLLAAISAIWRHAHRWVSLEAILCDVLARVVCMGPQFCIMAPGICDALIYAFKHEDQGRLEERFFRNR